MLLQDSTFDLIERAGRRGADIVNSSRRAFATPGIALAATQPGTFVDEEIDPATGLPTPRATGFLAGDFVGVKAVDG